MVTREFLDQKYTRLCRLAETALARHQPCKIREGSCLSMRLGPKAHGKSPFCCGDCKHLGPQGCTVESLYCKVWLCLPVEERHERKAQGKVVLAPLALRLERVRVVAGRYDLLVFRADRKEALEHAWTRSLLAYGKSPLGAKAAAHKS